MKKRTIQKTVKAIATVLAALLILATVILPVAAMAEGVAPEVQENPTQPTPASEGPQSPGSGSLRRSWCRCSGYPGASPC